MKPVIAIVGCPNVGKSTFFNRVTRTTSAIVGNRPGVTRDSHYGIAFWNDIEFTLIDTGGLVIEDDDVLSEQIRYQVLCAVQDADAIIFMLDGKEGVSPFDKQIANILRTASKPVFYVVNKIDGPEQELKTYDFFSLGMEKIYSVSAEHRYGIYGFLDDLVASFPHTETSCAPEMIRLAVVGRPNVGKSSLINRMLGQKRLIVSDVPGTTRDSIDTVCEINKKPYLLIDTAGIRRKGKVSEKLEKFSIIKSLKSLDRCDIALIIIDAKEGITDQDISIAGYAFERQCGCIFLLNKWDLVEKSNRSTKSHYESLRMSAKFLNFAPAMTISALTGQRVSKIFDIVEDVFQQYDSRVTTGKLNRILTSATQKNEPSLYKGKRLNYYYATQTNTKPPTFVCFVNYPEAVHFSYKRFLINQIRTETGLDKTPIRMFFRKKK
jgi:GTP-binding protein